MKKIFLDTNFIGDLFVERKDENNPEKAIKLKLDAQNLLAECKSRGYSLFITYLTLANINYLSRSQSKEEKKRLLEVLCRLFNLIDNTKKQVYQALRIDGQDFEDTLQYVAAKESGCDVIITRDTKGFSISDIPVYSPSEFMEVIGKLDTD